jgi:hydroxypyruvate reductase
MSDATPWVIKATGLPAAHEAALGQRFRVVEWRPGDAPPPEAAQARALISNGVVGLPPALAAAMPKLEIVTVNGVGLDAIDLDRTREQGVIVTTTTGALEEDVADLAIALWLAVARRLVASDRHVRDGRWAAGERLALARSAHRQKVGVLGLGAIGRAIAQRAQGFGGEVRYTTRRPVADATWTHVPDLVALADWADVLIVAIPGGAKNAGLVGREALEAIGPRGMVINIARGEVIDETALIAALEAGRLGGAGLDVFEKEPHVPAALSARDDVVLLPHVGSATEESRAAMADIIVGNLEAHFAGRGGLSGVVGAPVA